MWQQAVGHWHVKAGENIAVINGHFDRPII